MIKKTCLFLLLFCTVLSLAACNQRGETDLSVALLVPHGVHEDDSWIGMIWAGISGADFNYGPESDNKEDYSLVVRRVECADNTTEGYLAEIADLYDQGFRLIYLPGKGFAEALEQAQRLYPQCRFGAIDFTPQTLGDNVIAIECNAYQAGFAAGFVSALTVDEGRFGCILGEEENGSRQMVEGFLGGIAYANNNYGTAITLEDTDILSAGTFSDPSLGQQMAALLFEREIDCIFMAARATGMGGIVEGKYRRANGSDVWIIGSDSDQYSNGIYDGNNSVALTSAMRRYAEPIFRQIEELLLEGVFEGGSVFTLDLSNSGVGIAGSRNNLSAEVLEIYDEVLAQIIKGKLEILP